MFIEQIFKNRFKNKTRDYRYINVLNLEKFSD